jgi:erythromycin esterase-like protein
MVSSFKQQYTTPEVKQAIGSISSFIDTISRYLRGDEKFFAIQCAHQLETSFSYFSGDKKAFTSRDASMAEIVQDICQHIHSTKLMLWGHNMHIKQATRGNKNLGLLLRNVFGETYYAIGSIFSGGSYRVWYKGVLSQKSLPSSTSGEMAMFLSKVDHAAFWFKASDLLPYFSRQKVEEHEVGIVQLVDRPAANKTALMPFKDFDAYFYFKEIVALDIPAGN